MARTRRPCRSKAEVGYPGTERQTDAPTDFLLGYSILTSQGSQAILLPELVES